MTSGLSTLQDFPYVAAIQAVKDSLAFTDFDEFYQHLLHSLPQNSSETRKRYASLVTRWFFSGASAEQSAAAGLAGLKTVFSRR